MANPDAATLRANPAAAAELPADDAGVDEHLHATPEHPGFLRLRAGRTAATDPPAGDPAAAVLPADGARVYEHLHADVQHPPLLRPARDEAGSRGHPGNGTARVEDDIRKTKRRSSK